MVIDMTDFEYDIMQKKRTASGAFHRKCGSKSKKCSLPSDHLTQSQWKKRNGDVIVFSMDAPISWRDFKQLAEATQKEYLSGLVGKYNASGSTLSKMMGVSHGAFLNHCKSIGFSLSGCRGRSMSQEQRAAWASFLAPPIMPSQDVAVEEQTPVCEDASANITPSAPAPTQNGMMSFTVRYEGVIDPDSVANSLRSMLCGGMDGTVEIVFRRKDVCVLGF